MRTRARWPHRFGRFGTTGLAALAVSLTVLASGGCADARVGAFVTLLRTPLGNALLTNQQGANVPGPSSIPVDNQPVVIASRRVRRLVAGETLQIRGDFQLTNDVIAPHPGAPLRRDTYAGVGLVLASTPTALNGITLQRPRGALISWREHHHTFTPAATLRVSRALAGRTMYVNAIARAGLARAPHRCLDPNTNALIACAISAGDPYDQLGVLRVPRRRVSGRTWTVRLANRTLAAPVDGHPGYGHRMIVFALGPIRLNRHDAVVVSSNLLVSATSLEAGLHRPGPQDTGCNAFFSGQLYLSLSPTRLVGRALPALSGDNGFNLTFANPVARWREYGFWQAPDSTYGRRYVDLIVWASRAEACPRRRVAIYGSRSVVAVSLYR